MLKHKLQDLFDEVDELKNKLDLDKKCYDEELKNLFDWNKISQCETSLIESEEEPNKEILETVPLCAEEETKPKNKTTKKTIKKTIKTVVV